MSDLHFAVEADYANNYSENRFVQLALNWQNRYRPSSFCARKAAVLPQVLATYAQGVDALLITGDLATTGSQCDLDSAKEWIAGNASARQIPRFSSLSGLTIAAPKLVDVSKTLITIPGNHDRFHGVKNAPRSHLFEAVFGDNWDVGCGTSEHTNVPEIRKTIVQSENDELIILCADFSLRVREDQDCMLGYIGQGCVYSDICEELKRETLSCRKSNPQALIVWATHFPPRFDHPEVGLRLRLIYEGSLLLAAEEVEVRIILSGHTHISKAYQASESKVVVICAGTPIAFGKNEKHSFNTVILNSDQSQLTDVTVVPCDWDDKLSTFMPMEGTQFRF